MQKRTSLYLRIGASSSPAQDKLLLKQKVMPTLFIPFRFGILVALLVLLQLPLFAQQDPMFTNYMFNTLSYNPAYAGSKDYLSANIIYRNQWFNWNEAGSGLNPETNGGAPISQTFTIHSPVNKRVGLGFSVVNDKIGAQSSTGANISYAYRIDFGQGTLNVGLQAGFLNFRADWTQLIFRDPMEQDPSFQQGQVSEWIPNFGTGLYYYTERFYLGASVPRLLNLSLREKLDTESSPKVAKTYQHYYITTGAAIELGSDKWVLKPSILFKSVELFGNFNVEGRTLRPVGAPPEIDIDMSILYAQTMWLGTSFRTAFEPTKALRFNEVENRELPTDIYTYESIDFWVAFFLNNGARIGFSYDYPLNRFQQYSLGSFEVMIGYDFDYRVTKAMSPRYF